MDAMLHGGSKKKKPVANAASIIRANEGASSKEYMKTEGIFLIRSNHYVSDYQRSPRPPLHQPQPSRNLPFSARGVRPMVLGHSVFCTTTGLSYFPTIASDLAGTARRPNSLTTLLKSPSKIPYTIPGTSKNMLLQRINGHEKAAIRRQCNRTPHDVYSNTSLGSWFNAWCFHDATAT